MDASRSGTARGLVAGLLALAAALLAISACSPGGGSADSQPTTPGGRPAPRVSQQFTSRPSTIGTPNTAAPAPHVRVLEVDRDESVLRRRLATVDLRDERALMRFLDAYGASSPPLAPALVDEFVSRLADAAQSPRAEIRRSALALLGRVDPASVARDVFTPHFGDPDPRVRREAVVGRTRHGPGAAWMYVLKLAEDPDASVRAAVAAALGLIPRPEARERLLAMLGDADREVVLAAGTGLARCLQGAPPDTVVLCCNSERVEVRLAAARVLAALRSPEGAKHLVLLVDDPSWEVRREAIAALASITAGDAPATCVWALERVAAHAARSRTDRLEAIQALGRTVRAPDAELVHRLATADPDPVIRLAAARTLLARADLRGLAILVDLTELGRAAAEDPDDVAFVRGTADRTLQEVADDTAVLTGRATWRQRLPEVLGRLAGVGLDYSPDRLAETW